MTTKSSSATVARNSMPPSIDKFSSLPREIFYQIAYNSQNLSIIRLSRCARDHWKKVEGNFYTKLLRYYKLNVVLLRTLEIPKFQSLKSDKDTFIALYTDFIRQLNGKGEIDRLISMVSSWVFSSRRTPDLPADIVNLDNVLLKIAELEQKKEVIAAARDARQVQIDTNLTNCPIAFG